MGAPLDDLTTTYTRTIAQFSPHEASFYQRSHGLSSDAGYQRSHHLVLIQAFLLSHLDQGTQIWKHPK
jgi:hypothetical protein